MSDFNQKTDRNKPFYKKSFIFIAVQYFSAIIVLAFLQPKFSPAWDFTVNLLFYILVFMLPIFLFCKLSLKEHVISFLGFTGEKIHIGLTAAAAMFIIFFISHGFKFNIAVNDNPFVLTILGAALAGVFEETAFRGLYIKVFTSKFGFAAANIIVSFLFTSLHFNQIITLGAFQAVMLFIFSLFVGYLAHHTKSLANAIIVHAAYNILQLIF